MLRQALAPSVNLWLTIQVCDLDRGKQGKGPKPMAKWAGTALARVLLTLGPKGLEFGRYSIDYHFIRNYLHVSRAWGSARTQQHVPQYAKRLIGMYNKDGAVERRSVLPSSLSRAWSWPTLYPLYTWTVGYYSHGCFQGSRDIGPQSCIDMPCMLLKFLPRGMQALVVAVPTSI